MTKVTLPFVSLKVLSLVLDMIRSPMREIDYWERLRRSERVKAHPSPAQRFCNEHGAPLPCDISGRPGNIPDLSAREVSDAVVLGQWHLVRAAIIRLNPAREAPFFHRRVQPIVVGLFSFVEFNANCELCHLISPSI